jgi:hypothetical protein
MSTEIIIPAAPGLHLCVPAAYGERLAFSQVDIIAWRIPPNGLPVPITHFGPTDTTRPWMISGTEGVGFVLMPDGIKFNTWNEAAAWFQQRRAA